MPTVKGSLLLDTGKSGPFFGPTLPAGTLPDTRDSDPCGEDSAKECSSADQKYVESLSTGSVSSRTHG